MSVVTLITTTFLIIHAANSYILLTANLEDVQSLAKQLAASPVVDQLNRIWRRASTQFNDHLAVKKRANNDDGDMPDEPMVDPYQPSDGKSSSYLSQDSNNYPRRRKQDKDTDDLIALGKNASLYLKSIRRIFEKV